jgi:hypothetical protein
MRTEYDQALHYSRHSHSMPKDRGRPFAQISALPLCEGGSLAHPSVYRLNMFAELSVVASLVNSRDDDRPARKTMWVSICIV